MPLMAVAFCGAQSSRPSDSRFDNRYMTIAVRPGWTVHRSAGETISFTHGKYVLSINPMFDHASPVTCGRFSEVTSGLPSVAAVMADVDQPAGGFECSARSAHNLRVNKAITLSNLYTDDSKHDYGCTFPAAGRSVWFGSSFCGVGSESEYLITLTYRTTNVNSLPDKGNPELQRVFSDVAVMLKTLRLKPPLLISEIIPPAAPPGATVTIHGKGFRVPGFGTALLFLDFPNNSMPEPVIAEDGESLTFQVPTSVDTISCPEGRLDVNEWCVPVPGGHVDINDCPRKENDLTNLCGIPLAPAVYRLMVEFEGTGISTKPVSFTVTPPEPSPVSVTLIYPNRLVSPGDTITVRGSGFMPSGNTVRIGSAAVTDLSSPDGTTLTFRAPASPDKNLMRGMQIHEALVSNANGQSNAIIFDYR